MADIETELQTFKNARYGEDVRDGLVSAITKINENVESDTESAKAYAESASNSLDGANAVLRSVQNINTTLQSVVDESKQVASDTLTAEAARVVAENARVEAEALRANEADNYVEQAKAYMEQAQSYANSNYVTEAQSWAKGGTGIRTGEATDNAKYWAEQAAKIVSDGGVSSFNGRTGIVEPTSGDYTSLQITHGDSNVSAALSEITTTANSAVSKSNSNTSLINTLLSRIEALENKCPYEVGDIFITVDSTNPSTKYSGTTWERIEDTFLLAAGSTYTAGSTGGEAEHTLTTNEMPIHRHGFAMDNSTGGYMTSGGRPRGVVNGYSTTSAVGKNGVFSDRTSTTYAGDVLQQVGGGAAHNNMPPYLAVYVWKRTA